MQDRRRKDKKKAPRYFTQPDGSKRYLPNDELIEHMREMTIEERDALGFFGDMLANCVFPYTKPKDDSKPYFKRNGRKVLSITPGNTMDMETGEAFYYGLPYGKMARLVMVYICSEIARTGEQRVELGENMGSFLRAIGYENDTKNRRALIEQCRRLFMANILYTESTDDATLLQKPENMGSEMLLWNKNDKSNDRDLIPSYVMVNNKFYNSVMDNPRPVDLGVLGEMQSDILGIDLYLWLTYRVFRLQKDTRNTKAEISWEQLNIQFSNTARTRDFKKRAIDSINKIKNYWTGLNIEYKDDKIVIKESTLSVPERPSGGKIVE